MKHYALAMVNNTTGEIEHIATSQAPMADDKVGHPEGWETTHHIVRFEFDAVLEEGEKIFKARRALSEFEVKGMEVVQKASKVAAEKTSNIIQSKERGRT